jgi:AcrR family transcriptional regulator
MSSPATRGAATPASGARRRGRRPAGEDTRGAIVEAARVEFGARGYEGTTLRGVARAAGVDPRLVHHYFESKADLFIAAMDLPARPQDLVPLIIGPGPDGIGERLVRFFFSVWETEVGRQRLPALLGSLLTNPEGARMLREFLTEELFGKIAASLPVDRPQLRAALAASQMVGIAMCRYVVLVEPIASADIEDLVPLLAPTLQRYLTE